MQVSIGSASPRSLAISAMRLPSVLPVLLGPRPGHRDAVPPAVLSAQVSKSLSFFNRARLAGSFSRSANFSGPPSRIQSGKNALQPWNIAV